MKNINNNKKYKYINRLIHIPKTIIEMNAMVHSHAMSGDVNGALGLLDIMRTQLDMKPDITTMNTIINAYAQAGDKDGSIRFLNIMINEFKIIPGFKDKCDFNFIEGFRASISSSIFGKP